MKTIPCKSRDGTLVLPRKSVTIKYHGIELKVSGDWKFDEVMQESYLDNEAVDHEGEDIWELLGPQQLKTVLTLAEEAIRNEI